MFVGVGRINIHMPWARTLKDRRNETASLKSRLRSRFSVSVAEVTDRERMQHATLLFACVGAGETQVEQTLEKIERFLDHVRTSASISCETRVFHFDDWEE